MSIFTPLQYSPYFSELTKTDFYLKREDLFPHGGGGNKARMIDKILEKAKLESASYIVTAGGPHSNFNRALSLIARSRGFKLRIILFDKNPHIRQESLNKRVCDQLGTEYLLCTPDEVPRKIEQEMKKLREAGESPFFIYGGGKSIEGLSTYAEVVKEIKAKNQLNPDLIATTFATGTTFSGLYAGVREYSPETEVLGISIARQNKISVPIVLENLSEYFAPKSIQFSESKVYDQILDQYSCGDYGKSSDELKNFINLTMQNTGLILDEIYVGKALFGLIQYLKKTPAFVGKKVVFLLTGGVFNF